jgi:hypothetical protein
MRRKETEEEKIATKEVFDQIYAYRAELEKEMRGMTNHEKTDYMNRLGEEVIARHGLKVNILK